MSKRKEKKTIVLKEVQGKPGWHVFFFISSWFCDYKETLYTERGAVQHLLTQRLKVLPGVERKKDKFTANSDSSVLSSMNCHSLWVICFSQNHYHEVADCVCTSFCNDGSDHCCL